MAMACIQQNVGYAGMLEEISPNTSMVNSQTLIKSDDTRTRRSQDNMTKTKENRLKKVYSQKQYQGKSLTQYRGKMTKMRSHLKVFSVRRLKIWP